jgi:hypothetical protein
MSPSHISPLFPPLAQTIDRWRNADAAFARACSRDERGVAMVDQLRARGEIHRLSEIEFRIEDRPRHQLRALLVDEGVWSSDEAIDRLVALPFDERGAALLSLAPSLPQDGIGRALDIATRPCWGDDERWHTYERLLQMLRGGGESLALPQQPEEQESLAMKEASDDALRRMLLACRVAGQDRWIARSLEAAMDYVENDLSPQHAVEFERSRDQPLFVEFRRVLLASGRELWAKPWFDRVFDAEERREHLRRVVAAREGFKVAWYNRFAGLLQIAERLQGVRRATALRWAVACREEDGGTGVRVDLVRAAALAEGPERDAIVDKIEPRFDELDTQDQLRIIITLMPGASSTGAISLARRGLRLLASGGITRQGACAFLASIPRHVWSSLEHMDWEPALRAGSSAPNGWASHLQWAPYDLGLFAAPDLPRQMCDLIEERGLPNLLGGGGDDSLWIGAQAIHALSPAGRARLIAWALALDASAWRTSSVRLIARVLDDDDLNRLGRLLRQSDPEGECLAERGLAMAWAERGELDRALAMVERITDTEEQAKSRMAVAIAAKEVEALPPELDPRVVYRVLDRSTNELVRWAPQEREPAFADAVAERLDEESGAWARLEIWAALWPALSASMRVALASRIERAVEIVLHEDDRHDDALCAIAEQLPARLLERIWGVRASASGYQHALALFENRFSEFMLAGSYHHAGVLHLLHTLGGEDALFEHARWLAGAELGSSATDAGESAGAG